LPGLVVDRFGKALVCQFNTAGMALLEADVLAALDQVVAPEIIVLRNDSSARLAEGLSSEVRVVKGSVEVPSSSSRTGRVSPPISSPGRRPAGSSTRAPIAVS